MNYTFQLMCGHHVQILTLNAYELCISTYVWTPYTDVHTKYI
jgi:hypothetical protein